MVNGDFVWLWIDTSAMLIKDKTIKLEKPLKELNFIVETRKVRHAANFYVNQSKANVTNYNNSRKPVKTRDNNVNAAAATTVFCNTTNRSTTYQNKTDMKNLLYTNVINMNNEILPNVYNKDASFSALMKHHFSLYRKRAWRVNKEEKTLKQSVDNDAKKITSTKTPAPKAADEQKQNATSFLSVINEETNRSDQPNDNKKEKRFNFTDLVAKTTPKIAAATYFAMSKRERNEKFIALGSRFNAARNFTYVDGVLSFSGTSGDHSPLRSDIVKRKAHQELYNFDVPIFLENNITVALKNKTIPRMPVGILAVQLIPSKVDKYYVKNTLKLLIGSLKEVIVRYGDTKLSKLLDLPRISCFDFFPVSHGPSIMEEFTQ